MKKMKINSSTASSTYRLAGSFGRLPLPPNCIWKPRPGKPTNAEKAALLCTPAGWWNGVYGAN